MRNLFDAVRQRAVQVTESIRLEACIQEDLLDMYAKSCALVQDLSDINGKGYNAYKANLHHQPELAPSWFLLFVTDSVYQYSQDSGRYVMSEAAVKLVVKHLGGKGEHKKLNHQSLLTGCDRNSRFVLPFAYTVNTGAEAKTPKLRENISDQSFHLPSTEWIKLMSLFAGNGEDPFLSALFECAKNEGSEKVILQQCQALMDEKYQECLKVVEDFRKHEDETSQGESSGNAWGVI